MKKYRVNVNGEMYEIEVELLGEVPTAPVAAPTPAAAPASAPAAAPAPAASGAGETVSCPMPGTILAVNVNVGDTVAEGQVLFVLEAMKMENEIMAPIAGKITSVGVVKGASAQSGDVLCTIE